MEDRQEKHEPIKKNEPTSWNYYWTQSVWSPATKTHRVELATTYRSLPSEWISTPIRYHRNCRMRVWRRKGNSRSLSTELRAVWWGEGQTKKSWSISNENKRATRRQDNNKGNSRIHRENRAIQARTRMITETLIEETTESQGKNKKTWITKSRLV